MIFIVWVLVLSVGCKLLQSNGTVYRGTQNTWEQEADGIKT